MLNEDYKEMLRTLLNNKVRFLVVGAYAMGAYGYPRATGDFDIWVEASPDNSKKIYKALKEFGAPLKEITSETFSEKGIVFQIGVPPRRIDLITHIDGVAFKDAYQAKEEFKIEGLKIPVLSKANLIKNKKSTGREKDMLDVKYLKKHKGNS
ncbi:MAG: hypothetical protein C4550_00010 [Nitrospiraceae bacterium]|nr:MAG: hypothetical protein C4550_00010 [Nitrospiraceae bacterium]